MLLSDADILEAHRLGTIRMQPFDAELIQPCSIDIRLGHEFRILNYSGAIDPVLGELPTSHLVVIKEGDYFELQPGEFALATTFEYVSVGVDVAASLLGKSSLGRLGLLVHATAGHCDPGFEGNITLELFNLAGAPIRLRPMMRIGQLAFTQLTNPCVTPYGSEVLGSHYQGQIGTTESRAGEELSATLTPEQSHED